MRNISEETICTLDYGHDGACGRGVQRKNIGFITDPICGKVVPTDFDDAVYDGIVDATKEEPNAR